MAVVSRIDGQGAIGRFRARRSFEKIRGWRTTGPERTLDQRLRHAERDDRDKARASNAMDASAAGSWLSRLVDLRDPDFGRMGYGPDSHHIRLDRAYRFCPLRCAFALDRPLACADSRCLVHPYVS